MPIISFIVVLYLFPPCLSDICFHCSCDESSRSVLCTSPSLLIRTVSLLPWVEQIHLVGLNLPHPPHFLFHTGVRVLRINRCGLQELSAHSLLSLPNLEVLNLADNHLETLPTTLFRSLKHLRVVNVAGNRIFNLTPMPWILAENVILEELDLSDNPLSLSTKNTSLPSARQLYLSNSNLEMINSSAVLFQPSTPCPMNESCRYLSLNSLNVSRITTLDLSRNEELTIDISALEAFENISYLDLALNHLPPKFSDWLELRSHVKSLNISHSHLTYDTWSWCGKDLETLDVSGLKLKKMSLGRNCILRSVFARDNLLKSIYLEVISLETLHLDRNLFSEWPTLPPGVALENLHILSISSNLISLLPPYALSQFPALQHLDVSKNRLSEIDHQAFPSLGMQLVSIDLSFNQLVLLPHPVLPSLLYLDVSSNNLVTIDPVLFAGFPLLQNLRLANNPSLFSRCETKCWSDSLSELTNLIDLDLSNCALSRSLALSHLQSLRSLILRGNQIISINANDIPAGIGGAVAVGEQPIKTLLSPSAGARMSLAETLTNLVFAPITDIRDVKMSGNWMWAAKCEGEGAKLVEACDAMCKALAEAGCAIDGGKDSLSMAAIVEGEVVKAPGTLVLSAYAPCVDITKVITPDLKGPTDGAKYSTIIYVRMGSYLEKNRLGGSAFAQVLKQIGNEPSDVENISTLVAAFSAIQKLIIDDVILAGHDVSDGGFITALLEMAFAGNIEIHVNIQTKAARVRCSFYYSKSTTDPLAFLFAEEPGVFLEVNSKDVHQVIAALTAASAETMVIGTVKKVYGSDAKVNININGESVINEGLVGLREIWEETSDRLGLLQTDKDCLEQAKLVCCQPIILELFGLRYHVPCSWPRTWAQELSR
uniref:AIRS_C domain-containing protein n=1 Tax=Heterorhabditis bacteriophora TaxID=37862 RepID=A0A1I7XAQ0_HETBA